MSVDQRDAAQAPGFSRNTAKLDTDADRLFGATGGLGPPTVLLTLDAELRHLALDDAGIGTQASRRQDVAGIEHISESLLAQGLQL